MFDTQYAVTENRSNAGSFPLVRARPGRVVVGNLNRCGQWLLRLTDRVLGKRPFVCGHFGDIRQRRVRSFLRQIGHPRDVPAWLEHGISRSGISSQASLSTLLLREDHRVSFELELMTQPSQGISRSRCQMRCSTSGSTTRPGEAGAHLMAA